MRVVVVPATLALLPEYTSIEDPIADLRAAVHDAVAWLLEDSPAQMSASTAYGSRIGAHLLGDRLATDGPALLVVANGTATRSEKAPGHFDDRAASFDAAISKALHDGDTGAIARLDLNQADDLWAPDAVALTALANLHVREVSVDYDDDPYGVQYWVVRWLCDSVSNHD